MILTLDLAGHTGWALDYPDGPYHGVWDLVDCIKDQSSEHTKRSPEPMLQLWDILNGFEEYHKVKLTKVVFEETFGLGDAKYRLDSLQHCTILWCRLNELRWMRVSPGAWKKKCLGVGRATKQEYHAAAILKWPELQIPTDDEAAALWLLHYAKVTEK